MIGMAKNSLKKLSRRVSPGNLETRAGNRLVRSGEPVARQRLARCGSNSRISTVGRRSK